GGVVVLEAEQRAECRTAQSECGLGQGLGRLAEVDEHAVGAAADELEDPAPARFLGRSQLEEQRPGLLDGLGALLGAHPAQCRPIQRKDLMEYVPTLEGCGGKCGHIASTSLMDSNSIRAG